MQGFRALRPNSGWLTMLKLRSGSDVHRATSLLSSSARIQIYDRLHFRVFNARKPRKWRVAQKRWKPEQWPGL